MQKWYYIMWENRSGEPIEWSIMRTKPEFLENEMETYLRFGNAIIAGKAYAISPTTGKPSFTRTVQTVGLPF